MAESSDVPGVTGSRFSFRRRRSEEASGDSGGQRSRAGAKSGTTPSSTSPMDFWRSGQARTYRDPRGPRKSMSIWQRIAGFHFPAWVPVAGVIVVVFGILGLLFYTRSAIGAPRINDHWHAALAMFVNEEQQPRIAETITPQGIHTHGDGMIHIHPHVTAGEGNGAKIANFFGDQGGKLTNSEMRIPGRTETYKNGDDVNGDGKAEELRILRADSGIHPLAGDFNRAIVACNEKKESEFERVNSRYVPKDGDCIRIVFAPPEVEPVVEADRTIIPADQADREIAMEVTGSGATTVFSPASIDLAAGETVRVKLTNKSTEAAFHGLRFSGEDRQYGNSDDYVLPNVDPGVVGYGRHQIRNLGRIRVPGRAVDRRRDARDREGRCRRADSDAAAGRYADACTSGPDS